MMMGCVRIVVLELGNGPETKTTMLLLNADRCWLKKKKNADRCLLVDGLAGFLARMLLLD